MLLILTLCLVDAKPRQAPLPPQAPEMVIIHDHTPVVVTPAPLIVNAQLYQEALTYIDRHQPTIRYAPVYQPYTSPVRYATVNPRPFAFSGRSAAACSSGG